MRISEAWLKTWVKTELSTDDLLHRLTMAGLEVDEAVPVAHDFEQVVVAQVVSVVPHPDADKLRICQVNDGRDESIQVVCGAPNVAAGIRVPFARVGARIGDDFKIKKAKLRGVESYGMLCSAFELGLSEDKEGLMTLPEELPLGQCLREALELDDVSIDIDLTPNRGDCLSVMGIAREVRALTGTPVCAFMKPDITETSVHRVSITVDAPVACPVYFGRVVQGVNALAQAPLWVQERLRRSGVRSVNAIVDATNYVLLEVGQPTHAFDLRKLKGSISVRQGKSGEPLELLNGQHVLLTEDALVIADQQGPVALAGIMGGLATAIGAETRDLFLECAHFEPVAIAGRARTFGLHTDSSHRFERGVDPELPEFALARLTELILQWAGGEAGPICRHNSLANPSKSVGLRRASIERLLGMVIEDTEVEKILGALGMGLASNPEGWMVSIPSFRFDISMEADLIEELARVYGYDRVPAQLGNVSGEIKIAASKEDKLSLLKYALAHNGYHEVISYSFIAPALVTQFFPDIKTLKLENPISQDMSVMRPSLIPGLVSSLSYNLARQCTRLRVFESGLNFVPTEEGLKQIPCLAGLLYGSQFPEQWGEVERAVDFYDLKGDVERVLASATEPVQFVPTDSNWLHPGQSAELHMRGVPIGVLGALHPRLESELGFSQAVWVFEIDFEALATAAARPRFEPISRFPGNRRDIAVIVDDAVSSDSIVEAIYSDLPEWLGEVRIFDVYRGKGIDFGKKSVALGLTLQASSRTLTDEEVDQVVNQITTRLTEHLGAILRE